MQMALAAQEVTRKKMIEQDVTQVALAYYAKRHTWDTAALTDSSRLLPA
jgi:hypothetical protein